MRISKKLYLGFALVTALAIIIGLAGIVGMRRLLESGISMYETQVTGIEYLGRATSEFKDVRLECSQVIISSFYDDLKGAMDAKERFDFHVKEFIYWMEAHKTVNPEDESIRFYDRILTLFQDEFIPKMNILIEESINDVPNHANKLEINVRLASVASVSGQIENLLVGIVDLDSAMAEQTNNENIRYMTLFMRAQYLLLACAILAAVIITLYITGNITRPIEEAASVLNSISRGDFEARVEGNYKGEFAIIKNSVNTTAVGVKSHLRDKLLAERSANESALAKGKAEAASEAVFSSIRYASKIQKNLLPSRKTFDEAFSDYSVIWKPRDIVGGDIYWIKNFDEGTILCVCDCTGHGTPGALLTMLVVSMLETIVDESNYRDTAWIIYDLDQKLSYALKANTSERPDDEISHADLNDGCDIAVLFVAKDGGVDISSANTSVFICDGKNVTRIKGQRLYVGEGTIGEAENIRVTTIPANPDNKFYIASDGLYDQIGGPSALPLGYRAFKQLILEKHNESQEVILDEVWKMFESYRGDEPRRDDLELISFKP